MTRDTLIYHVVQAQTLLAQGEPTQAAAILAAALEQIEREEAEQAARAEEFEQLYGADVPF